MIKHPTSIGWHSQTTVVNTTPYNDDQAAFIENYHFDNEIFDISQVNPKEVDALLVRELNQLSLSERERIVEEVHGVYGGSNSLRGKQKDRSEEEEANIRIALGQMQVELKNIPEKPAYDEAIAMKSPLLNDLEFQTKFVYAENFDPFKAAKRIVKYLELAKELFGVRALHRAVQWKDLSPNALEIINRGELQAPPLRDQAHRRICVLLKDDGPSYTTRDQMQVWFYINSCLSEDLESQRLGYVFILFLHQVNLKDVEINRGISRLIASGLIRISGLHICSPDSPHHRAVQALVLLMVGASNRSKVRFHIGSPMECLNSLRPFGIPTFSLPSIPEEVAKDALRKHYKWCLMRQTKEGLMEKIGSSQLMIVECPFPEDCLFGKGQTITKHPGNVGMRKLVESRLDRYQVAAFKDKSLLAWEVVHEVKDCGGRFLKERLNGLFVEVDDETCRKKVSIAFRDLLKKSRQQQGILDDRQDARKHKMENESTHFDCDGEFELFPQQKLENDSTTFCGLSGESRKRQKGLLSPMIY